MDKFLDKIFFRSRNLDYISQNIKKITQQTSAHKVFEAINNFNETSEVRYVGGCIRKIINKQKVDDIDLATNLEPKQVCEVLQKNNIDYYETGIDHGTITAVIDKYKFENLESYAHELPGPLPEGLEKLPNLSKLHLCNSFEAEELNIPESMINLREIFTEDVENLRTLNDLSAFPNLETIDLQGCYELKKPDWLEKLDPEKVELIPPDWWEEEESN